jgi:hypothetical protein
MGLPAFSTDGRRLILSADYRTLEVRDGQTWALLFRLTTPLEEQAHRVVISAGGRFAAAIGARQEVYLWDPVLLEEELTRRGLPAAK